MVKNEPEVPRDGLSVGLNKFSLNPCLHEMDLRAVAALKIAGHVVPPKCGSFFNLKM